MTTRNEIRNMIREMGFDSLSAMGNSDKAKLSSALKAISALSEKRESLEVTIWNKFKKLIEMQLFYEDDKSVHKAIKTIDKFLETK